jgi:arginyl-tRNA synthetase
MKSTVEQLLKEAFISLKTSGVIPSDIVEEIKVERCKEASHGDYATNIALILAKPCRKSPRDVAELLVQAITKHPDVKSIGIAGPGFINFRFEEKALATVITTILQDRDQFGRSNIGQGVRVLLEFVSANPTGPLHVGHGRSAAFGATLANVLKAAGFQVSREYYVNDAGRQMNILAASVWLRYLEIAQEPVVFPTNGYRGAYVLDIAQKIFARFGKIYVHPWSSIKAQLPLDEPEGGNKELYIDAVIKTAEAMLSLDGFKIFHQCALNSVLDDIKDDLAEFGVTYDDWFSEQSLSDEGAIDKSIQALKEVGFTYEQEGALWFKATSFGDEKDRVLVRANGQTTYFASDVAYHWNKYDRGFERVMDVFGADHHGYISRITAAVKALGHDDTALCILLVQFAILYRGALRVQMSTRSGEFVTLRELREEVGNDAARFFYVMRKPEQHMDFDLDLAKSQSSDNPVYYIQYAHARICSVLRQVEERGLSFDEEQGLKHISRLDLPQETILISLLGKYPEVIEAAAENAEPHQLAYFLRELAHGLHSYYNAVPLLCPEDDLRQARLCLIKAVRQVLRNGVELMGVSAPESM